MMGSYDHIWAKSEMRGGCFLGYASETNGYLCGVYCRMDGFGSEDCAVGGIIARYWESKHLVSKLSTAKCNLSFSFQIPA